MKKTLTVVKFGGSVLDNLTLVLQRIGEIKKTSQVGPVVVVSAPRTKCAQKRSLTDIAIELGESFAEHKPRESGILFQPYIDDASFFVKQPFKDPFNKELTYCQIKVNQALNQIHDNKRFVDVNRARLLAYSGEFLMAILMDYILRSSGFDSIHFDMKDWPIVTDENFENANFLISESAQRTPYLEDSLE